MLPQLPLVTDRSARAHSKYSKYDPLVWYNSTHTKSDHRLYKVVFPGGLDEYRTPSASLPPSRSSTPSIAPSTHSSTSSKPSLFGRFLGYGSSLTVPSRTPSPLPHPDGPPEEAVISGTAFGGFIGDQSLRSVELIAAQDMDSSIWYYHCYRGK